MTETGCKEEGACLAVYVPSVHQKPFIDMSNNEKEDAIMMHKHIINCYFCRCRYIQSKIYFLDIEGGGLEELEVMEENENILNLFAKHYNPN